MGQVCCNTRNEEKKTIDVSQIENINVEEPNNNSKNVFIETNAIMICSNKTSNDINYNIKYKPKTKKIKP